MFIFYLRSFPIFETLDASGELTLQSLQLRVNNVEEKAAFSRPSLHMCSPIQKKMNALKVVCQERLSSHLEKKIPLYRESKECI